MGRFHLFEQSLEGVLRNCLQAMETMMADNDKFKTTMKLADERKWREFIDKQRIDDPYTVTILGYAAGWAERIEAALENGTKLTKEIAQTAEKETRKELGGLTMSMFGTVVNILFRHWAQGSELEPLYAEFS
ncbi:hypothetical protein HYW59_02585 [Candidatus Kaiserbacteria bacterium]|nr:hypothetical protein [Candidatus Kaiserbacteria bacterium]